MYCIVCACCVWCVCASEPGYYQDGAFGIRIENLVVVRPRATEFSFMDKQYLGFETITLVPLDRRLINRAMLNEQEVRWIDDYHAECRKLVAPRVRGEALEWLMRNTEKIGDA